MAHLGTTTELLDTVLLLLELLAGLGNLILETSLRENKDESEKGCKSRGDERFTDSRRWLTVYNPVTAQCCGRVGQQKNHFPLV